MKPLKYKLENILATHLESAILMRYRKSHTGHGARTVGSANVKVHNVHHGKETRM
jgi:hypothetical protein